MRFFKIILNVLSSKALTVWLLFVFVIYYLTTAVWFGEAFGRYIYLIAENNLARIIYIVFFLNILLRIRKSFWSIRKNYLKLFLQGSFYVGIVLFMLSSFLSVNLRQTRWLVIGERDVISLPWEKGSYRIVKIDSALKEDILRVDDSPVFDYEPYVTLMNTINGQIYRVGAFPAKKVGNTYMHILNFGIAPVLELREQERVIAGGPVVLRLIPFGSVDSFELKELNYKFYIHVIPNMIIKRGNETARNYNIEHPRYQIQVLRGDKTIFDGSAEDEITFDGRILRFYKPVYWVQLELVYDPVYPFFIGGLFITVLGAILYPFSFFKSK